MIGNFKMNQEKEQGEIVYSVETREYHLLTEEGLDFIVREEDACKFTNFYTNLSEDGKSVDTFRLLEYPDPIIDYMDSLEGG